MANSRLLADSSIPVYTAPWRAKFVASVPMPQPISKTRFPFQRGKSANRGICGSTKYLRASTCSKYSRLPTGSRECRILHGRRSQYDCTSSMAGMISTDADIPIPYEPRWHESSPCDPDSNTANYKTLSELDCGRRAMDCTSALPSVDHI